MVLDYSKWDRIELSDDSDIEVHPNVDKRSFINAKRRQIHETRQLRRQQIEHYKTERSVNGYLTTRLDRLLSVLESRSSEPPQEVVMSALIELSAADDGAPPVPAGAPSYAQMMAALVDTVKKEVDEQKPDNTWTAFVAKLKEHRAKLVAQTEETARKQAELEKEEASKITTEGLHEGFSSGHVNKSSPSPSSATPKTKTTTTTTKKVQAVEQLNDPSAARPASGDQSVSSGAEADVEEDAGDGSDDAHIEPSAEGREFARIKIGDYRACMDFISKHPSVVAEKETDGLLVEAFNSQIAGKDDYARQCVHQALLLQYCRQLGRDGVTLFFRRITTPNHQAQRIFHEDVNTTYARIRERAKEISRERAKEPAGVEQIQLHAVDPNTTISISVPPADSPDPALQKARAIYDTFPPGLQRALESGSLDEVNKVLGKMSVDEAEEIVGQLGEGGMLSLESQIIDATTEDGQKVLAEIEKEEQKAKDAQQHQQQHQADAPSAPSAPDPDETATEPDEPDEPTETEAAATAATQGKGKEVAA